MNAAPLPDHVAPEEAAVLRRRRRGRNIAVLVVLIGVSVLFYAVAVVKLTKLGAG